MKYQSRTPIVSLILVAFLGFALESIKAQDAEPTSAGTNSAGASSKTADSSASSSSSVGGSGFSFPSGYSRRLLGQISIGESRDQGITNGRFPQGESPTLSFTDLGASLGYHLETRSANYMVDYHGAGRHYNRYSFLDVNSHDVGLSQTRNLGAHTAWDFRYRYSSTPDLAGSLMAETLTNQMAFINPLPVMGIRGIPIFGAPFTAPLTPADGLISLRSLQMKNSAYTGVSHDFSYRAKFAAQVGFDRVRFEDKSLFGDNRYFIGAGWSYMVSPRTSVEFGYQGGRIELVTAFDKTDSHGVSVGLSSQLTRRTIFSIRFVPSRVTTDGQQVVSLPTVLANLLGQQALTRNSRHVTNEWLGSTSLATSFHNTSVNVMYQREITDTRGLGGAAMGQTASLSVTKSFRKRTNISGQISIGQYDFLGVAKPIQLVQEGLVLSFDRELAANLDFRAFFNYAKILNGVSGPKLLGHNLAGVLFTYHFPRIRAEERR